MSNRKRTIELPDEGSEAVIIRGGIRVAFNADGGVTVYTNSDIKVRPAPGNNSAEEVVLTSARVTNQAYNIGDVLPDGWVVGPVSPDTGIVMAIEPAAGALDDYKTWHQGQDRAAELRGKGNANARQPSDSELNAIYNDVVKAGRNGNAKLNTSGFRPFSRYWSCTTNSGFRGNARIQCLGDGNRYWDYKADSIARVRCVRDEPGLTLA